MNFKRAVPQESRVLRGGSLATVLATELVPGDVVEISYGEKVPADVRVLKSARIKLVNVFRKSLFAKT